MKVFEEENRIEKKVKGGSKPKLSPQERMKIKAWLDDYPSLTLVALREKLVSNFQRCVSLATIDRATKSFQYTVKRISLVPHRRNDSEVIELRYQCALKFTRMSLTKVKMFFLDEFRMQVWSRRSYGRSMVGQRANKRVKCVRSKNYSVCAAMNCESLYFFEVNSSAYKSVDFSDYLNKLIGILSFDKIENAFIIMDNARIHKTQDVINVIENAGHRPVFLPPWCPFLNPIENLFSQWKAKIKSLQSESEDELYENITKAELEILAQDCKNYFKNMQSYIPLCL